MVVAKQSPYEEFRLRRLEENKKRMEALNLPNLCQTLRLTSVKTSPVVVQRVHLPRRVSKGRDLSNRVYVSEEIREEAFSKAEKLQADLRNRFPSFVKSMLQSHVSGGFWLGLPVHFCRSELQKQDGVITLIDEEGEEFETVYLAKRTGLSGGWLGFAVSHNLVYGDALVFELVRPTVFKVYITRVKSSGESLKM
ncbi:hypothetical protein Bca4012_051399 [Brassica carinata]